MDFFERQERARRSTAALVLVFLLAVAGIVLAVDAVAWAALAWMHQTSASFLAWMQSRPAWIVTGIALAVLLGGSALRWFQLAHGGGGRVAILMGGRIIDPATQESRERRLINVVEEMAVASGVTLPDVYVLDNELSINAFAAGLYPAQAVIVVTKGTLNELDRDELQGVIGHEFSHILNGDMRLNLQLLALLAGITVIGQLGASVFRGAFVGGRRRRVSGGRGGSGALAMFAIAAALVLIGWIGVFAGRVIKAAVSRQREFLADAASVQFTRNPDGIAGALLKIRDNAATSLLRARHAEEVSHMAFGRAVGGLTGLTATHPPLEARMRALGPKYALWFRQDSRERARRRREAERRQPTGTASATANAPATAGDDWLRDTVTAGGAIPVETLTADIWPAGEAVLTPAALAVLAGSLTANDLDHARMLLERLPATIRHALQTPEGATRVVYALLFHGPEWRDADAAAVPEGFRDDVLAARTTLEQRCPGERHGDLDARIRLPVLELAIPALRRLPEAALNDLLARVDRLIRVDERMSLFEFTARTVLHHELVPGERHTGRARLQTHFEDARTVVSLLCVAGATEPAARASAYERAMRPLFGAAAGELLPAAECTPAAFTRALQRLDRLQPSAKRALLLACADCIAADRAIGPAEAELWRAIATSLGVPVPPLGML